MKEKATEILFIPKIMIVPLIISTTWNSVTYFGSRLLTTNWHHTNAEIMLDSKIPFVPWTVFIYLGCYIFWIVNYILGSRQEKEEAFRLISADFIAIHCLTSWFCYIAVRKNKNIPKPYVWFSLLFAISVCISTLTTKQHVIVDVIGGVGLAEGSYFVVKYGFTGFYENLITKINRKLNLD